jgi:hypothetical protein
VWSSLEDIYEHDNEPPALNILSNLVNNNFSKKTLHHRVLLMMMIIIVIKGKAIPVTGREGP